VPQHPLRQHRTATGYLYQSVDEATWTGEFLELVEELVYGGGVETPELAGDAASRTGRVADDAGGGQHVNQPLSLRRGPAHPGGRRRASLLRLVARDEARVVTTCFTASSLFIFTYLFISGYHKGHKSPLNWPP